MEVDLPSLIPGAKLRKIPDLTRPNVPVVVWGTVKLTKSPRKPRKEHVEQLTLPGAPEWGKAFRVRQKPGPKSLRPFWESVLGRPIPDRVWHSAMKATQYGRGSKPITAEDLRRRIAIEEDPRA